MNPLVSPCYMLMKIFMKFLQSLAAVLLKCNCSALPFRFSLSISRTHQLNMPLKCVQRITFQLQLLSVGLDFDWFECRCYVWFSLKLQIAKVHRKCRKTRHSYWPSTERAGVVQTKLLLQTHFPQFQPNSHNYIHFVHQQIYSMQENKRICRNPWLQMKFRKPIFSNRF